MFDINKVSPEIRVAINKAAQEDLYMSDLEIISEGATDHVHAGAHAVMYQVRQRFEAHLAVVPHGMMRHALEYIDRKVDEMILDRFDKAQRMKVAF